MTEPPDLPCNLFVELVTDYLEGALDPDAVARVDAHLAICAGCREILDQWRAVIALSRRIGEEHVDALASHSRDGLMAAFRQAHSPSD